MFIKLALAAFVLDGLFEPADVAVPPVEGLLSLLQSFFFLGDECFHLAQPALVDSTLPSLVLHLVLEEVQFFFSVLDFLGSLFEVIVFGIKFLQFLSQKVFELFYGSLIGQTFVAFSFKLVLNGSDFTLQRGLSASVVIDKPGLVVDQLFQFLNNSLVSAALASFLLDFLPQEADGFCVFLLFFCVELGLSVEFVGQFDFLVEHLLDLLYFSLVYHALPSLVLDGLPQCIDFLVMFHANAVAFQNLFFAFAQHCL